MPSSSWLTSLASHPIFDQPSTSTLPTSLPDTNLTSTPTAKPKGYSLFDTPSNTLTPTHSTPSKSTPIRSAAASSTKSDPNWTGKESKLCIIKGKDLILAVGNELRMIELGQVKARELQREQSREDGDQAHNQRIAGDREFDDYKILHAPTIKFEIKQLVLNPTGKLLAVIGEHSVTVVVLPRKGWSNMVGKSIECRSLQVGRYYHALTGSPPIASVLWHPWGQSSSSLLILTNDSILREFDISIDVEEPAQTIHFHNESTSSFSSSRGLFSAEDENAKKAVGMCVGDGKADWGPLTVYALMRNGDILAVCPFLPKKSSIPASYIHALSCFVSTKVDYLSQTSSTLPSDSLALTRSSASSTTSTLGAHHFTSLYAHQLQYVNNLVRQVTRSSQSHSQQTDSMDLDDPEDRLIQINAPKFSPAKIQGPFLFQPAPLELEGEIESLACDLIYLPYSTDRDEGRKESVGLGVLAIGFQDGKVDLCIEVEKVEPRWLTPGHHYDDAEEAEVLPSLCVYETIDLGLLHQLKEGDSTRLEKGWVAFVKDPIYQDTLYVQHSLGAHCLVLSGWLDDIARGLSPSPSKGESDEEEEEEAVHQMERIIRASGQSEVIWIVKTLDPSSSNTTPIVGIDLINDVYVGYSILLVTNSLQLVGIELSLRVDSSLLPSTTIASAQNRLSSEPPPYLSLLEEPFEMPSILSSSKVLIPRQIVPKQLANRGALETVTPDSLRFVAKAIESIRSTLGELVGASDQVQNRLELQLKELSRQLSKVSELRELVSGQGLDKGLNERVEKAKRVQAELLRRSDKVLQRLMDQHAPEVSTFEQKWFDELGRLEKEIKGGNGAGGLEMRLKRVAEKVEDLRPGLEEMKRKELANGPKENGTPGMSGLGGSQLKKVEEKLADEANLLAEARRKVDRLTQVLGATSLGA